MKQQTKTIALNRFGETDIDVFIDILDGNYLVGEINGDTNAYDSKEDAIAAYESITNSKTLCEEMGWT